MVTVCVAPAVWGTVTVQLTSGLEEVEDAQAAPSQVQAPASALVDEMVASCSRLLATVVKVMVLLTVSRVTPPPATVDPVGAALSITRVAPAGVGVFPARSVIVAVTAARPSLSPDTMM